MLLFKTGGDTLTGVLKNEKHASHNRPRSARAGDLMLLQQTKQTLDRGQKSIKWVMTFVDCVPDTEGVSRKIFHRQWRYLIVGRDVRSVRPFDLEDVQVSSKNYVGVQTHCQLLPEDEEAVLAWIEGKPTTSRAPTPVAPTPPTSVPTETPSSVGRKPKGRTFGPPLNFRELRYEPINEAGVIYLFGMVARELGFVVESIATGYPDCDAKRRTSRGLYEAVRIEFEFKASNFATHRHDPAGCDLIVCWEDDWPNCPVDVLELKDEIKKLSSDF